MEEHQGFWAFVPALTALVLALWSKRTFESLLGACLVGFVLIQILGISPDDANFLTGFVNACYKVIASDVFGFVLLVCGLFGSLIAILIRSGGTLAFGDFVAGRVKTAKGSLFLAWILGLAIFIDDYLNALTVSFSMRRITDKFRVSREMLAYVVDSTGAPICVLVPISTWGLYTAGLLIDNGLASEGQGLQAFLKTIPYNLYAIAAMLLVPLVALGIVPLFGPMKKAEQRARNEGVMVPPETGKTTPLGEELVHDESVRPEIRNFAIPIVVLIAATLFFRADALKGVIVALAVTFLLFTFRGVMKPADFFNTAFQGFRTLVYPIAIVAISYVLVEANKILGLTPFIIETVQPFMSPRLLPAVAFVSMALVMFATGSFWGVYAIALPVILPLAEALGTNPWLAAGAVISAGAFGSHCCPYGDCTVLSSAGAGCDNISHVRTQLPYGLLAGTIAVAGYIVLGFVTIPK